MLNSLSIRDFILQFQWTTGVELLKVGKGSSGPVFPWICTPKCMTKLSSWTWCNSSLNSGSISRVCISEIWSIQLKSQLLFHKKPWTEMTTTTFMAKWWTWDVHEFFFCARTFKNMVRWRTLQVFVVNQITRTAGPLIVIQNAQTEYVCAKVQLE